jgi:fimbrial chaperone protein
MSLEKRLTAITLLLFSTAIFAGAGSLSISPVRIDLTEKRTNALIQITNAADDPITMQLHAASWTIEGSQDLLRDTNDIVVNPPVFNLAPGQKQIIRLGIRSRTQTFDMERCYRLILEEVPKAPKEGTITTVLRVTLPIFHLPRRPVAPVLVWQAILSQDGDLKLRVNNEGSAHAQIREVVLAVGSERVPTSISSYVLPGGQREFEVRDKRLRSAGHIGLDVVTDAGKIHEELTPKSE